MRFSLFISLCLVAICANAQIIPPFYVGNLKPILDQNDRQLNHTLVEIRSTIDGIIRPPYPDGSSHYKNPLLRTSLIGTNAMENTGLFCEVFIYRIDPTNRFFARAYNAKTIQEATFYMDTPLYSSPSKELYNSVSSVVLSFGKARPIDPEDDDGDGLNNSWERALGIDDRPSSDYDGDGFNDYFEMLAGTAPDDPSSLLAIKSIYFVGNFINICWFSVPSRGYQLQATPSLLEPFTNLFAIIVATSNQYEIMKTFEQTNRVMHYRVTIP